MLFSGKENVFMCLVAFQKMFRKIFSGVWLCSWKYLRKHIFYLLLTFSWLPNKYIISFIPQCRNTNKTQKKKNHQIRLNWEKKEQREVTGFDEGLRSVRRQDRDRRGASCDRDRWFARSRSMLRAIAIGTVLRAISADDFGDLGGWSQLSLLSFSLSFSRSLSLLRVTRKWFEGKMKV